MLGASCSKAADGGVFVSEDQGVSWQQKVYVGQNKRNAITISAVDVRDIVADPHNSDILYVATKADGIYKTENAGEQWTQVPLQPSHIRDVAINTIDSNIVYTVRDNTIIKSIDGSQTWEIVYTDSQAGIVTRIELDWFNPDNVYAVTSIGTVLKSEDAGITWRVIHQVDEPIVALEMDPTDSRVLYILELDRDVYKTTDGGLTWTNLVTEEMEKEFKDSGRIKQFAMDPNDSATIYTTSEFGLLQSLDGGTTWQQIRTLIEEGDPKNETIQNLSILPGDSNVIFFTVGKLIHKTFDGGLTWETLETFPSQRRITSLLIDPKNPERIFAGVELVDEGRKGFISK